MTITNWAGNVTFAASGLRRPRTVDEVQQIVAGASRVRALGTGHSFSRIADTDGVLVSVADLDTGAALADAVHVDEARRTASVPAGVRFGELGAELHRRGWALENLGSLPHISVAGACATGTHGSGSALRCLAASVTAVEFVDGRGELVALDETDPAFRGSVLALGSLGIATGMTLRVEPTYDVRQDVWLDLPWSSLVSDVDAIMAAGYSVSVFAGFRRPDVADLLWIKSRGDAADASVWGATRAAAAQHPDGVGDPAATTAQLGVPGPWHERLPHFDLAFTPSAGQEQQSEYLVPRSSAAAALTALHQVSAEIAPALRVCEIRTVAADELWLSPCHGRDTLAVHATWAPDDRLVRPAVAALERALAPFDPRPHWGKVFTTDPAVVRSHYPRLDDVRELVARHDPQRRFVNDFTARHLG